MNMRFWHGLALGLTFSIGALSGRATGLLTEFHPGDVIQSSAVNQNFQVLQSDISSVDQKLSSGFACAGTITAQSVSAGSVTVASEPTTDSQVANKAYVDTAMSSAAGLGLSMASAAMTIANQARTEVSELDASKIDIPFNCVAGDMLYFNGSNFVRLPKGVTGQVLKMGPTAPVWAAP